MASVKRLIPALFVVLWATGFITARYAMPWIEPFLFLAVRFGLTAVIFAVLVLALGRRFATGREAVGAAAAGTLMHGAYLGGVFWAVRHGLPAGLAGLVVGLQPLITALLAGPLLGERVLPRHWLGLGLGFVGVAIVIWPKLGISGSGVGAATLGAALAGVVAMSAGTIVQKRFGGSSDLLGGAFWQDVGATTLTGLASLTTETWTVTFNHELVLAMLWSVLVMSLGAILLLMVLIRDGEVSRVASLFYLVPAVTAL
ncbi:MAG: DMT family transporter, partial [Rhizobiaceae bacterium]|nr:DMT family transporter [Rhizobiaceae bacterium]